MSSQSRVVFDAVWKKFARGEKHDSLRDLIPALARRIVGRGAPRQTELADNDFWAVRDLSFEVLPGKTLGIIGPNGSGKSTTLRMLTKILEPTRGHAEVRGRMGALIEVSAGFHGDLTGRENVFLQGAIMGMRSKHIERKFDEIVEFSGIPEFIDTPVKRYSSGMNARLGFAIAAHLEPDVLIIDEVLAVGDMSFQERAYGRIKELARSGIPVVIVSHQLDRVADLCTEALLLNRGEVAYRGSPMETINAYVQQPEAPRTAGDVGGAAGDGREAPVGISDFRLTDDRPVMSGDTFTVEVTVHVREALRDSIEPLQLRLRSLQNGRTIYITGSRQLGVDIARPGKHTVRVDLQANTSPGSFVLEVAAFDVLIQKDTAPSLAAMIQVLDPGNFRGWVQLNPRMSVVAHP
jgi:ABC-type polysaccharide/polyol phosphate transport system ATPase subunit